MYRGLKKKYTREQFVKLALTVDKNKCYFCLNNIRNYTTRYDTPMNELMDKVAGEYFDTQCRTCINNPSGLKASYHCDNFKTLYDWEENSVEGANNV